jgi:hypothetical protein
MQPWSTEENGEATCAEESSRTCRPDNSALPSLSSETSSMTISWSCGDDDDGDDDSGDDDGGDDDDENEGAASTTPGKFALQRATLSAQARPLETRLSLPTTRWDSLSISPSLLESLFEFKDEDLSSLDELLCSGDTPEPESSASISAITSTSSLSELTPLHSISSSLLRLSRTSVPASAPTAVDVPLSTLLQPADTTRRPPAGMRSLGRGHARAEGAGGEYVTRDTPSLSSSTEPSLMPSPPLLWLLLEVFSTTQPRGDDAGCDNRL